MKLIRKYLLTFFSLAFMVLAFIFLFFPFAKYTYVLSLEEKITSFSGYELAFGNASKSITGLTSKTVYSPLMLTSFITLAVALLFGLFSLLCFGKGKTLVSILSALALIASGIFPFFTIDSTIQAMGLTNETLISVAKSGITATVFPVLYSVIVFIAAFAILVSGFIKVSKRRRR